MSKDKDINFPIIRRVEDPDWLPAFAYLGALPAVVHTYRMGECFILFMPPQGQYGNRLVIACKERYPTVPEMIWAWQNLAPVGNINPVVMGLPDMKAFRNTKQYGLTLQDIRVAEEVKVVKANDAVYTSERPVTEEEKT